MKIGKREVGPGQPCYIIAEAGTGHAHKNETQRIANACNLAGAAKKAGADAVKFQMFIPESVEPLFCPMPGDGLRWARWRLTYISLDDWRLVTDHCADIGIDFLASAFQPTAVQWLKELGVPAYKVASRAAASYPYDSVPGPFLISNGMTEWGLLYSDIRKRVRNSNSLWLQCRMQYPTPLNDAVWDWDYDEDLGLSDHSGTPWPALDAMARGCPLVEVHFAIDKAAAGNDAAVALSTDQLKLLCEARDGFAALRSR